MEEMKTLASIMNPRTIFTRKCIGEAVLSLMQDHPLSKISVTSVVNKAGIARMTFYTHYNTVVDSLTDYLQIIVGEFRIRAKQEVAEGRMRDYPHILFALNFFDEYRDFFLILAKNGLHYILLDGVNHFMEHFYHSEQDHSIYEMYCYAGGLLNTFLKWEEGGKKEPVEEVAKTLHQLYQF